MSVIIKFISDFFKPKPGKSSLGFLKYPSLRDHPLHSADIWLEGKRLDDNAENLWRIHNNLYDLTSFIEQHPGGSEWLTLTKGTDISEAFECHHISTLPEQMLSSFLVGKANTPPNTPFTFDENGFYRTLKRRVRYELQNKPSNRLNLTNIYTDTLFLSYITLALLAAIWNSNLVAIVAGMCLAMTTIASHNYFHQKDNFRMYYFDFSMMSSRDWRITHALSHHIYTNTIYDYEISFAEPFFQYLPIEKHVLSQYLAWFYQPIAFATIFMMQFTRCVLQMVKDEGKSFHKSIFLPLIVPLLMLILTDAPISTILRLYAVIIVSGSFHFGFVGLNAAHHHPDIFHDGDTPKKRTGLDWGIHQIGAVMDRKDINQSDFLILTNFGDHCLHHLFPTLDHHRLRDIYMIFHKTCKEFNIEHKISTQYQLIVGQYKQLMRTTPK